MIWFSKLIPIFLLFGGTSFLAGLARNAMEQAGESSKATDVMLVEVVNPDYSRR